MKIGRKLFGAGGVGGYRTREINNRNDIWALFRGFHSLLLSLFPRSPDESWLDSTAQSTKQGFIEALPWALHWVLVRNTLKCNGLFCAQGEKTVTHEKANRTKALYRQEPNGITEEPVTHKCSWWWEIEKTNKQPPINRCHFVCLTSLEKKTKKWQQWVSSEYYTNKDDLKSSLGLLRWGADLKGALLLMENRHQRGEWCQCEEHERWSDLFVRC